MRYAPRIYMPVRIWIAAAVPFVLVGLGTAGFKATGGPEWTWLAGAVCTILADHKNGVLHGGADTRRPAYVLGW